jgi:ATP-dependent DNA ligase
MRTTKKKRRSSKAPAAKLQRATRAFVTPMAAQVVTRLPEGNEWVYELKFDGYRALLLKDGQRVEIRSRKNRDLTKTCGSERPEAKYQSVRNPGVMAARPIATRISVGAAAQMLAFAAIVQAQTQVDPKLTEV